MRHWLLPRMGICSKQNNKKGRAAYHAALPISASKSVSRVLYLTVIYLGIPLPICSSHLPGTAGQACCPPTVLLRIEFTASHCLQPMGELLPRLSTLTARSAAVYLCCTFPEVAFGGRYPLSLPYGARTFLMTHLSVSPRDCLAYSHGIFYRKGNRLSTLLWCCCLRRMGKKLYFS